MEDMFETYPPYSNWLEIYSIISHDFFIIRNEPLFPFALQKANQEHRYC